MHRGAPEYFGMWMAMMVPMMLPSLVPLLARYRLSVRGADGLCLHGLMVLVGLGYFAVWAAIGAAAYAASSAAMALALPWQAGGQSPQLASGMLLLVAGGVQLSPWKARQLARCRDGGECCREPVAGALEAVRQGLGLGVRCSLCCGSLMLVLLGTGAMNEVAMVAITLAISAERLGRAPLRVARVVGMAMILIGILTLSGT
jgi:predicted metal-binding membrane protein